MDKQRLKKIGDILTITFVLTLFTIIPLIFILDFSSYIMIFTLLPLVLGMLTTKIAFSLIETREERIETNPIPPSESPGIAQHITAA